jgi:hypothetical protein
MSQCASRSRINVTPTMASCFTTCISFALRPLTPRRLTSFGVAGLCNLMWSLHHFSGQGSHDTVGYVGWHQSSRRQKAAAPSFDSIPLLRADMFAKVARVAGRLVQGTEVLVNRLCLGHKVLQFYTTITVRLLTCLHTSLELTVYLCASPR